jgi:hypothetical protein
MRLCHPPFVILSAPTHPLNRTATNVGHVSNEKQLGTCPFNWHVWIQLIPFSVWAAYDSANPYFNSQASCLVMKVSEDVPAQPKGREDDPTNRQQACKRHWLTHRMDDRTRTERMSSSHLCSGGFSPQNLHESVLQGIKPEDPVKMKRDVRASTPYGIEAFYGMNRTPNLLTRGGVVYDTGVKPPV